MSEIDEPLPREHAACIVRASEVMVKILDIQQQVADLNLMGIAAAASTAYSGRVVGGRWRFQRPINGPSTAHQLFASHLCDEVGCRNASWGKLSW